MTTVNVFYNDDLREYIFDFVYPKKIQKNMLMHYLGTKHQINFHRIGHLYKIQDIKSITWFFSKPCHTLQVTLKGIHTKDIVYYPYIENDIIKVIYSARYD